MEIIKSNIKKVISILVTFTLAICGLAVYFLNGDKSERVAANPKSEEVDQITEETNTENSVKDNEEEKAVEENQQAKADEVSNVKVEEKKEEPKENVQKSEKPKETPKANKNQQPQKEPIKPAAEPTKTENKVTSYTSKGLGISLDFPGNWNGKYVIKDNGDELAVYMKHSRNSEGLGLLFIITSNLEDAQFLDTIYGINKEQTINGKKLAVGGPADYKMIQNDPLEKQYREMSSQRSEVLRTLR